jgi:hypothetical protein
MKPGSFAHNPFRAGRTFPLYLPVIFTWSLRLLSPLTEPLKET